MLMLFQWLLNGGSSENRTERLQRLMTEHGTAVLRVCFLYLKDHALSQDAAQTTFFKAWQAMHTLRSSANEKAWLMRIAVNTCKTMLRSAEYRMYAHNPDLDELPEPSATDEHQDDTVLHAVMDLPLIYREVTLLHYYQGLTTQDVARVLQVPQSTVLTRLHRARKLLESMLKGWYFDNE